MGEHKERYYFELAIGAALWSHEACVSFEVEEGRRIVCSVALAKEARYGKDALEIREALEKQLRADMKERAAREALPPDTAEWVESTEGPVPVPRSTLEDLGYVQLPRLREDVPEHWRKTLDKL